MTDFARASSHDPTLHEKLHSVFVRRAITRLPRTDAEKKLPIQRVDKVQRCNTHEVSTRLHDSKRARFLYLLDLLRNPAQVANKHDVPVVSVPPSRAVSSVQASTLAESVVVEKVTAEMEAADPSRGEINAFFVVEWEKQRLRAIHHTKWANEQAYAHGYKCQISDLQHISAYLGAVTADLGATADIHASFYHVEIPQESRCYYRFRDADGTLYQLSRAAMGHCIMPEIMQTITNVLAGNQLYVKPEYAVHVPVHVWIDNIRHYGGRALLRVAQAALRDNARALGLELNIDEISDRYVFIGVLFDHRAKTVRVADKTLDKLPTIVPSSMTAREIEMLVSRLLFVAGVRQTPLVNHWWCLKWARRVMNALNTGRMSCDTIVQIPASAHKSLVEWKAQAHVPHSVVTANAKIKKATLFTDATLVGWGGVIVCSRTAGSTAPAVSSAIPRSASTSTRSKRRRLDTRYVISQASSSANNYRILTSSSTTHPCSIVSQQATRRPSPWCNHYATHGNASSIYGFGSAPLTSPRH